MGELEQKSNIAHLYYTGQMAELDCGTLCRQLGLKVKLVNGLKLAGAEKLLAEHGVGDEIQKGMEEMPAYVSGRISALGRDDFTISLTALPQQLAGKLKPEMMLHVLLIDPTGSFSFNGKLLEVRENDDVLRVARTAQGVFHRWRRFMRVAIRGRALFVSEEAIEGEKEGALVDLGGAGVRIETGASWLNVGDELSLVVETGFLDEQNSRHYSLGITVPSRVVWLRRQEGTEDSPVYQVGLAFTEINMVDQDRLIGFILAYESSQAL
jgi:hypothetical protein